MEVYDVAWFRFCVPLRQPIVLAGSSYKSREGLVVRIRSVDGREGWGEAAPLPGFFGWCPLDQLVATAVDTDISQPPGTSSSIPAINFAISTALEWLRATGIESEVEWSRIVASTLLINREDRASIDDRARLWQFKNVKVKVGGDVEDDVEFVLRLKGSLAPETRLRADANRRWTTDQAISFGKMIGLETLDFLEEPCSDPSSFRQVKETTGLRIAADESIQEASDISKVDQILDDTDVLIIKPTMIGSLSRCIALAEKAYAQNVNVVVSSAYETGVGMRGLLFLLKSLRQSDPAPGLGTYAAIANDLLMERLPIERSEIDLSNALAPVEVNQDLLQKVS